MEKGLCREYRMETAGKRITVYPASAPNMPVIYLNTFAEEGGRVYQALRETGCPNFSLVEISGLTWNHDMAPWDIPPISSNDTPCTGGANAYLKLLTDEIVAKAEHQIPGRALWRGLAGYSLAGLFAIYAVYQTGLFSRAASISGSLWYPGFTEYVCTQELKNRPERLYFSLGDRESRTRNPFLKTVQENTEKIEGFFRQQGLDTVFQLNPGNHYKNAVQRTAAGIAWILGQ